MQIVSANNYLRIIFRLFSFLVRTCKRVWYFYASCNIAVRNFGITIFICVINIFNVKISLIYLYYTLKILLFIILDDVKANNKCNELTKTKRRVHYSLIHQMMSNFQILYFLQRLIPTNVSVCRSRLNRIFCGPTQPEILMMNNYGITDKLLNDQVVQVL